MNKFYLSEVITKDKLVHQGLYFEPAKKNKKAILWVHGLTDNFYGDWGTLEEFATVGEKQGWAVASFNTRGHDIVTSIAKLDSTNPKGKISITAGSAYEHFSECTVYSL